jgi:hypothetical protein
VIPTEEILRRYFLHTAEAGVSGLHYEVIEELDEMARAGPDRAWPIIAQLIDLAPSEAALDYLVAGPLEILLSAHGESMSGRIRTAAERSEPVRAALSHVLLSDVPEKVRNELGPWIP